MSRTTSCISLSSNDGIPKAVSYTHLMGSVDDLMDRPRKRIVPQASIGAFLHFFKVKLRFAFSGCLVKNTLGDVYKRQSLALYYYMEVPE